MIKVSHTNGFSIIELMITILVSALLLTVGVPSFQSIIQNNRITSQANEILTSLNLARSEAIKRGERVSICPTTNNTSCAGNTTWTTGWLVFNDPDGNGVVANANDILRIWESVSGNTTITSTVNYLTYEGNGSANNVFNLQMAIPGGSTDQTRRVCVALAGTNWINRPSSNC